MSRTKARKALSIESFEARMAGRSWQASDAVALLDEHPDAYKPIDLVMRDQADLVEVEHELEGLANYKGRGCAAGAPRRTDLAPGPDLAQVVGSPGSSKSSSRA